MGFVRVVLVLCLACVLPALAANGQSTTAPGSAALAASRVFNPARAKAFHDFGSLSGLHFDTSEDAKKVVDLLLSQFELKSQYDVFVTDSADEAPNAQAFFDPETGHHQIVFNRKFLQQIRQSSGTPWALYGMAAHEIAHLMALHYERRLDYHTQELEADFFAGFALGKMGVENYEEAVSFIRALPTPNASVSHPARARRLAAMGAGWAYATNHEPPDVASSSTAVDGPGVLTRFKTLLNRDLYGHDINTTADKAGTPGLTLEACAKACNDTKICKGFSFNRWKGRCFLKDDIKGPATETPAAIIGIKPKFAMPKTAKGGNVVLEVQRNTVYLDEPIDPAPLLTADYTTCQAQCVNGPQMKKCVAFSFYKTSHDCKLFSASEGYFYDQGVDSGYKRQEIAHPAVPLFPLTAAPFLTNSRGHGR